MLGFYYIPILPLFQGRRGPPEEIPNSGVKGKVFEFRVCGLWISRTSKKEVLRHVVMYSCRGMDFISHEQS